MSFIGNKPATSFESPKKQVSTSNSGTTITLDYPVTSVADIRLTINAVLQSYDNYSVSGSTLTVGGTLNNDRVEILFVGRTYGSIAPSDASIVTSSLQDGAVTNVKLGTDINATKLTAGLVPTARLGSGTASSSTILYGDQTYKTAPSGSHVKLLSGSASSSVNHDFQNFMDTSKYRSYLVQFTDVVSAGNDQRLDLQFIANTTVSSGSNYWGAVSGLRSSGTQYFDNYEQTTQGRLGTGLVMNSGNAGNYLFYVFNAPNQQDMSNSVYGQNWGYRSDYGDYMFTNFAFSLNTSDNITGMRIAESGGNATTFDYQIYGILK